MKRLIVIRSVAILLGFAWSPGLVASAPIAGSRPNIIFILTDDQGYGDISAHGNPVLKTPNMDRLRAEGARFTDFHVSPTCAPTRSALMTGRHEFKNGVTHTIFERERLTLDAITLPQVLKQAGYSTGIFGKWHLGDEAKYQPEQRGFDEVFIHGGGGLGQTYPGSCGDAPANTYFDPAILHNGRFVRTKGFCTDVFFAQATQWIETVQGTRPFFAYLALNAPHSPYTARPVDAALYSDNTPSRDVAHFFGMVHNIDENIGRLLARLDALGLRENTLVIFMNDNGGTAGTRVFNAGMRGQKGTPYLGGTRASSFWRWPGKIAPRDVPELAAHLDFFPTLAEIAGAKLDARATAQVEGRSLVPLLGNFAIPWGDRTLFTHVGRWERFSDPENAKFTNCSVRTKRWHLVSIKGGVQPAWELYDIITDPGEKTNVAGQHTEVVMTLAREYDAWWIVARAGMVNEKAVGPRLNPFAELYWKQFGGGPDAEDLRIMEPSQVLIPAERTNSAATVAATAARAEEVVKLFPAAGGGVKFSRSFEDKAKDYHAIELENIFQLEGDEIHVYRGWKHDAAPFATLVSADDYENCVIELEYKWGERRFAPRTKMKRDAGLLFFVRKPEQVWPPCIEFQIQETDSGDIWSIYSIVSVRLDDSKSFNPQSTPQLVGQNKDFTGINRRDANADELPGWNTIRVELRDGAGKYFLNGKLVNAFEKVFEKDGSPLKHGRIALQAEGAEITYRNVRVTPLH